MIIGESKLDDSYPTSQFHIEGFHEPFRQDRDKNGGGLLIYVNECISTKKLNKHVFPDDIEGLFIELNFRKTKWLLVGTYHPPKQNDEYYFGNVGNALDTCIIYYDKFIFAGDFNAEVSESKMDNFLGTHGLSSLIHEKTCFKSLTNPSCIDLFLTNSKNSFINSTVLSTGTSDFHEMIVTVFKTTIVKGKQADYISRL